jgi:hypothetical protein
MTRQTDFTPEDVVRVATNLDKAMLMLVRGEIKLTRGSGRVIERLRVAGLVNHSLPGAWTKFGLAIREHLLTTGDKS